MDKNKPNHPVSFPIIIREVQNGYILTDQYWIKPERIESCYVFESLPRMAEFIAQNYKR